MNRPAQRSTQQVQEGESKNKDYARRRLVFGVELVKVVVEDDSVLDILDSIGIEIQTVLDRLSHVTRDKTETQTTEDSESEKIEPLLGVAFLICQIYINSVADNIARLRDSKLNAAERDSGIRQQCSDSKDSFCKNQPKDKWEMLDIGPRVSGTPSVTKLRAIYEAANYFRHRDEWPLHWSKLLSDTSKKTQNHNQRMKSQVHTQRTMCELGCSAGSNGNLRIVFERLGCTNYADLDGLRCIVRDWSASILAEFKSASEHERHIP